MSAGYLKNLEKPEEALIYSGEEGFVLSISVGAKTRERRNSATRLQSTKVSQRP